MTHNQNVSSLPEEIVNLFTDERPESTEVREALVDANIPFTEIGYPGDIGKDLPLPTLAVRSLAKHLNTHYRGAGAILYDFMPAYIRATPSLAHKVD